MINQLLKFPISGSKETRCGSGLRRVLCLAALLVFFVAEAWSAGEAFSYDLWVGGVKVKSSNASNITGDNIRLDNGESTFNSHEKPPFVKISAKYRSKKTPKLRSFCHL